MRSWLLLLLLVTPTILQLASKSPLMVSAEDEVEEDGVVIEDEDSETETKTDDDDDEEDDDSVDGKKNVSPDADTTLVFVKPSRISTVATVGSGVSSSVELPAGKTVEFLVGFSNKGESEFLLETIDASFRYPMDFSFHIQNFSALSYMKKVKSKEEATIAYSFIPADAFAGRPIGLTINLAYRDGEGNFFFDPVFNETVQIVEFDEGFDTEVFFMYVLIVAIALLSLFLLYNFTAGKSKGKKPASVSKRPVETGTANDDVDYEWIPRSALRTPGSNKTSPRQRRGKAGSGGASSDDE